MARMFRVLSFWTAVIALLSFIGDMPGMSLLFFAQTALFLSLGYFNLSERGYMYIFAGYLVLFFVGFTYYTSFVM